MLAQGSAGNASTRRQYSTPVQAPHKACHTNPVAGPHTRRKPLPARTTTPCMDWTPRHPVGGACSTHDQLCSDTEPTPVDVQLLLPRWGGGGTLPGTAVWSPVVQTAADGSSQPQLFVIPARNLGPPRAAHSQAHPLLACSSLAGTAPALFMLQARPPACSPPRPNPLPAQPPLRSVWWIAAMLTPGQADNTTTAAARTPGLTGPPFSQGSPKAHIQGCSHTDQAQALCDAHHRKTRLPGIEGPCCERHDTAASQAPPLAGFHNKQTNQPTNKHGCVVLPAANLTGGTPHHSCMQTHKTTHHLLETLPPAGSQWARPAIAAAGIQQPGQ